jgi:hypothetical protein
VTIDYIARQVDGALLLSEPLPEDDEERLSPDTARRLIIQLRLPSEAWLWAGDPYRMPDDDWPDCDEEDNDSEK